LHSEVKNGLKLSAQPVQGKPAISPSATPLYPHYPVSPSCNVGLFWTSFGTVRPVTIEILLPMYDRFVEQCDETSREYAVLKNGLIFRRKKEDHFERFVKIECTIEDAKKLLLLATQSCPDIVADIARGISTALKSD
jgi:hypothetical protein